MTMAEHDTGIHRIRRGRRAGFALTNFLISSTIFIMLVGGVIASHLFGLQLMEFARIKLGVHDSNPRGFNVLRSDLRSARLVRIGLGDQQTFAEAGVNALQHGNALQVYLSSDTNQYIRYFVDTSDRSLKRLDEEARLTTLFTSVSNDIIFSNEDFAGRVLTNRQLNAVVGLELYFFAVDSADVQVGPDSHYTSYQVRLKAARRPIE